MAVDHKDCSERQHGKCHEDDDNCQGEQMKCLVSKVDRKAVRVPDHENIYQYPIRPYSGVESGQGSSTILAFAEGLDMAKSCVTPAWSVTSVVVPTPDRRHLTLVFRNNADEIHGGR